MQLLTLLFAPERPAEELYLCREDRWRHTNLAAHSDHARHLRDLRGRLDRWIKDTGDRGPESPETYDLGIQDELRTIKPGTTRHTAFRENAQQIKRWAAEGR